MMMGDFYGWEGTEKVQMADHSIDVVQ